MPRVLGVLSRRHHPAPSRTPARLQVLPRSRLLIHAYVNCQLITWAHVIPSSLDRHWQHRTDPVNVGSSSQLRMAPIIRRRPSDDEVSFGLPSDPMASP